ncbi:hypothetical protein BDB00DRAFT_815856 [Zychaea mexicana]|uniref:uncharacterized protein n=1 Tax=Zychaea mexicana TaxID=64656 RepID=UPI0022FDB2AC|nr:uncharacterized protein BDB00DRAFT_815856 [Zychaea mexicana]KAI9495100.1 hypothetical protein BDB00DRAFT_815856 [Zychaea mexicana]
MPLLSYSVLLVLVITSYAFNWTSLILPKWLTVTLTDGTMRSYGLFQLCHSGTNEACQAFPGSAEKCAATGMLCPIWQTAGAGMILAGVVGALAIVAVIGTMCSIGRKRDRGWKVVSVMLVLHAVPGAVSVLIMAHLCTSLQGTRCDVAFFLATAALVMNLLLALIVSYFTKATPSSSSYAYEPLEH